MKRFIRLVVLLVIVAGVGAALSWRPWESPDESDGRLVLYGNIDRRQVDLALNVTERIAVIHPEEGDRIRPRQLLAHAELERFEIEVEAARAALEAQRQVVARLEAGSRPEEIEMAKAEAEAAHADYLDAQRTYERNRKLFEQNAVSQQTLDDSQRAFESAKARWHAAEAKRKLVEAGPRKEDIAEARAVMKRLESQLKLAEHVLDDAHLYSPCHGIIQERLLEVGDMASPARPIFTVALIDPVWVRAYVSEPDLGRLREGMKAEIRTDSFPNKTYEGWVGFISPTAEFTPKPVQTQEVRTRLVYEVRVFVKNPQGELRLGMPVTVYLIEDTAPSEAASP